MQPRAKIDIQEDIRQWLLDDLFNAGLSCEPSLPLTDVVERHLLYQRKLIPNWPRRLLFAEGLVCPRHLTHGFINFEDAVLSGHPLKAYQSRKALEPRSRDGMEIDWGIQHFHLGAVLEENGFVTRSDPLLFAKVTDRALYCIGFWSHGEWSNLAVLRALHQNWPAVLEPYRVKNAIGLRHNYDQSGRSKLRKGHVNAFVEIEPGLVFAPPGGGQMANGYPAEQYRHAMRFLDSVDLAQAHAEQHAASDQSITELKGTIEGSQIHICLPDGRRLLSVQL